MNKPKTCNCPPPLSEDICSLLGSKSGSNVEPNSAEKSAEESSVISANEKRFFKPRHLNKLLVSDMHNSGKDAFSAVALTRGAVSADRLCTVHTAAAVYSLHCIGKHRRQEPELIHSFLPSSSLHRISALGTPWTQLELDQDIPTMCGVILAVMFRVLGGPWGSSLPPCSCAEALLVAWPCQT